jgi:hypothetical protein
MALGKKLHVCQRLNKANLKVVRSNLPKKACQNLNLLDVTAITEFFGEVYAFPRSGRRSAAKLLSKDEVRRIAAAKLPELLR